MKRFARVLVVILGLAVIGSVVSLVPQKNATAQGGPTVTIGNPIPLPVTGSVSATVSGQVGINGAVGVTNQIVPDRIIPLFVDAEEAARNPYTASCVISLPPGNIAGDTICQLNQEPLPGRARLVIDTISGNMRTAHGSVPERFELHLIDPAHGVTSYPVMFSVLSGPSGGNDVYQWMNRVQIYVDSDRTLYFDTFAPTSGNGVSAEMTISGHFVSLPPLPISY